MNPQRNTARKGWKQNPEKVREDILAVASIEFAEQGFSGARVNIIAERTQTSKRMIYYYFGDKAGLYKAVIARTYETTRQGERELDLNHLSATAALEQLIEYTFNHHRADPHFIRLVMVENIHEGQHLPDQETFREINAPAIEKLSEIYQRGVESGEFLSGIPALHIHWQISALCFFNVSNRITFSRAFGQELYTESGQKALLEEIKRTIIGGLRRTD